MPSINLQNCYKCLSTESTVTITAGLTIDEAATLLAGLSNQTKNFIATELTRIMGADSTYTYKAELIKAFQLVMAHLRKTEVPDTEKKSIAQKLLEGIDRCATGYHDRVNHVLLGLSRPQTIDELLERIRINIVDTVARAATDEVHHHNSFFQAAAPTYGIRPINSSDVYSRTLTPSESQAIDQAFAKKYHPIAILADLQTTIESELRCYHGSEGKKTIDAPYELGPTIKIMAFLNTILGASYTEREIFVWEYNEDRACDVQTDINWPFIQDCLWKKLQRERYIDFSAEEKTLLSALYAHKIPTAPEGAGAGATNAAVELPTLLSNKAYQSLFYSLAISQYPEVIKSAAQKVGIAEALVKPASEGDISDILAYLKLIHAFFSDNKELYKRYANQLITPWLRSPHHIAAIFTLELDDLLSIETFLLACERLPRNIIKLKLQEIKNAFWLTLKKNLQLANQFITLTKELDPTLEKELLTANDAEGNNALMIAIVYQPTAFSLLFEHIKRLEFKMQKELLTAKNNKGGNALMIAAACQPTTLSSLLEQITTVFDNPVEQQDILRELLTAKTTYDSTALMVATAYHPTTLSYFLEKITTVFDNPTEQKDLLRALLTAKNLDGVNVLMIATEYQPESLSPLLEKITTVFDNPTEQKDLLRELLTAKNNKGGSALMLAAECQPEALSSLLEKITTVFDNPTEQKDLLRELLTAKTTYDSTALMLTTAYHPTTLSYFLEKITTVFDNPTERKDLLRALLTVKNLDGVNVLMIATEYQPESLSPLLEKITTVFDNPTEQKDLLRELLTAKNNKGENALMLAAKCQPESLSFLLENITTVFDSPAEQKALFRELLIAKTTYGYNALMIVTQYQPAALSSLLEKITIVFDDLAEQNALLKELLTAKIMGDHNFLISKLYPGSSNNILPLLDWIKTFDPSVQREAFVSKDKKNNALTIVSRHHPQMLSEFLDINLDIQLEMLKHADPALKPYKEKLIPYKLEKLKQGTAIQRKIHEQLNYMKFNASSKRQAILIAIDHLQPADGDIDTLIKSALQDPKSELHRAFEQRRYTFFIPLSQRTRSLSEILKTIDNLESSAPTRNPRT